MSAEANGQNDEERGRGENPLIDPKHVRRDMRLIAAYARFPGMSRRKKRRLIFDAFELAQKAALQSNVREFAAVARVLVAAEKVNLVSEMRHDPKTVHHEHAHLHAVIEPERRGLAALDCLVAEAERRGLSDGGSSPSGNGTGGPAPNGHADPGGVQALPDDPHGNGHAEP